MKKYAVIGLGNFGFHAAKALFVDGHEVITIDTDRGKVQAIGPFATSVLVLDATDKEALHSLGLEEMDAVVVSIGTNISVSIMVCLYLNELGGDEFWPRPTTKITKKSYCGSGPPRLSIRSGTCRSVSRALCPNLIYWTSFPSPMTLTWCRSKRQRNLSIAASKRLNLRAKHNVHIIAIKKPAPNGSILVPPADYEIQATDTLMLLGKTDALKKNQGFFMS